MSEKLVYMYTRIENNTDEKVQQAFERCKKGLYIDQDFNSMQIEKVCMPVNYTEDGLQIMFDNFEKNKIKYVIFDTFLDFNKMQVVDIVDILRHKITPRSKDKKERSYNIGFFINDMNMGSKHYTSDMAIHMVFCYREVVLKDEGLALYFKT